MIYAKRDKKGYVKVGSYDEKYEKYFIDDLNKVVAENPGADYYLKRAKKANYFSYNEINIMGNKIFCETYLRFKGVSETASKNIMARLFN